MDLQAGVETSGSRERGGPVLHIVVVGFHHKKGCQVEFSYPPLIPGEGHDRNILPEEWKYLPFLALPDGAHNFQEDTVFFHLPPRSGERKTVYGVSCYRQIDAKALKVRQADVTRETVQKSVCVLSQLPLYGLLQAKLQLITHAYFEEKDFSQISILKELYEQMNSSFAGSTLEGSQLYLGLSPRDLVLQFRHRVLILFKLILLEKKVLFYVSPVHRLVGALMTVLSLFPGMIEHGLTDSSQYRPRQSIADERELSSAQTSQDYFLAASFESPNSKDENNETKNNSCLEDSTTERPMSEPGVDLNGSIEHLKPPSHTSPESTESDWETLDPSILEECIRGDEGEVWTLGPGQSEPLSKDSVISGSVPITVQPQSKTGQAVFVPGLISGLEEDKYGMPLAIFTKGYLCLPYMALQQHHLLSDVSIRGFVAGATNILFRQQKHLSDAIVECNEECPDLYIGETKQQLHQRMAQRRRKKTCGQESAVYLHLQEKGHSFEDSHVRILDREEDWYKRGVKEAIYVKMEKPSLNRVEEARINIHDPELRKVLNPTTADLRFIDHLVKHVTENRDDVFLDGTGWEGGDEWIRAQFALYLHSMLSATTQPDNEKILSDYGNAFVGMWKITHNYRVWNSNKHPTLAEVTPSHPFQGHYSVADVKLRLSHSVQNSERGKKIGNAVVSTSRNMVQTGKAVGQSVGGALISAKSAMSSWLSTFSQLATQETQEEKQ